MCTAATYKTKDFYFGRTLDYEFSYGEEIIITPRHYSFPFRHMQSLNEHYALIGMACCVKDYPLYYDAVNEKGLCMAGLNFVGNAFYHKLDNTKENIASFEFIPWILGQCASVKEAKDFLSRMNLIDTSFSEHLPASSLHWLIADRSECITIECVKDGLKIYDNPVGILTNNPPFDMQLFQLNNYMQLSEKSPKNHFSDQLNLDTYSRGMGALGLPGDLSSQSRFIRAAFTKMHSISDESETGSVNQFYHILGSVEQTRGCCEVADGKYELTIYTSCCNADKGIYYYTTYENRQIHGVSMQHENLNRKDLIHYPLIKESSFSLQN